MDLASLGIRVTTQGVQEAEKQLDGLAKTGAQTAQQTQKVAPAIEQAGRAAQRSAPAMKQAAMSARELQFATRQLPMQFTDIVTSLQAGHSPLQVLIQQGGQLKDTFGGIGPAARAMGGYVMGLVNPLTLAAGAAVALGVAWNKAQGEQARFNEALVLTGNQAGLTVAELDAMARSLDASTNATQGKAAAVLAEVTATGKFTAEQIEQVTRAALLMEDATGKSIESTITDFASLKGEPLEAIQKLNEAIGDGTNVTGFLTEETLKQIRALEDQGRTAAATDLAMQAYFNSIDEAAPRVREHLTALELVWRDIAATAAKAGDAMVAAFRDADTQAGRTLKSVSQIATAFGPLGAVIGRVSVATFDGYQAQASMRNNRPDFSDVVDGSSAKVDSQRERARQQFEREGLRYASERTRMEREIAEAKRLGNAAGLTDLQIQQRIAAIRKDYAEREAKRAPKARKPREVSDRDSGASLLSQIRQQIALTEQEALTGEKLTASDRLRVQMQQLLADGKSKVTAATREAMAAGLEQLQQNERLLAIAETNRLIDEESATRQNELAQARQNHERAIESLTDDMEFELSLMGKSNIERAQMIALRHANVDAASAEGQAIAELAARIERTREVEGVMFDLKSATADFAASAMSNFGDIGDEFENFGKRMQRMAAQMLADKALTALFNMFMGGGGQGSGLMAWATGNPLSGGWSGGGYTGPGGKYEPAGIVHKGEGVLTQEEIADLGGPSGFYALRAAIRGGGYANGGVVGQYAAPRIAGPAGGGSVKVEVYNNSGAQARTEESRGPDGSRLIKVIVDQAVSETDRRIMSMGSTGRAIQQRFGTNPQGVNRA